MAKARKPTDPALTLGVAPEVSVPGADPRPDPDLEVEPLVRTFMATGSLRWEAMVALVDSGILPRGAFLPIPEWALADYGDLNQAMEAFAALAESRPVAANHALNAYLDGRNVRISLKLGGCAWVTLLPDGLRVRGNAYLGDTGLTQLPANLTVSERLHLGRTRVANLPEGLKVGELNLVGNFVWDGRIPQDAEIELTVWTDRHPGGLTLDVWRTLHPHGERA
jgi:hypothetical protein